MSSADMKISKVRCSNVIQIFTLISNVFKANLTPKYVQISVPNISLTSRYTVIEAQKLRIKC